MRKYDDIVIGSGVSGLTAALLLAQNDRKVLLLEKSPHLGGSLSRFYRGAPICCGQAEDRASSFVPLSGTTEDRSNIEHRASSSKGTIPFDTGFHFTGGLLKNEVLASMLSVLKIKGSIKPVFLDTPGSNRIIFEKEHFTFDMPFGIQKFSDSLKKIFREDIKAIDAYADFIQKIYDETVTLDLKDIDKLTHRIDEDYITFKEVLDNLTDKRILKSILSSYCLCYGTRPAEISYANHCRISAAFYESIARIEGGGDAIINAFKGQFIQYNTDVSLNTYIEKFTGVENRKAKACVLNTGETVCADDYIFGIHPKEILKILPVENLTKGFVNRVEDFEASIGFFSLYCVLEDINSDIDFKPGITTLYPEDDLNVILGSNNPDSAAIIILKNVEVGKDGIKYFALNILETSSVEDVGKWNDTKHGHRPKDYLLYKKDSEERILARIFKIFPEYKGKLKVIDSASILTYKDYLNSYDGSAYGIKQKIGQFNLFGRLPIRNIFAIGQSAVLPGIVGSMLSSFMLGRVILGEEAYNNYVKTKKWEHIL